MDQRFTILISYHKNHPKSCSSPAAHRTRRENHALESRIPEIELWIYALDQEDREHVQLQRSRVTTNRETLFNQEEQLGALASSLLSILSVNLYVLPEFQ